MGKLQELLSRNVESELIPSTLYGVLIDSVRAELVGTQVVALRFGPNDIKGSSIDVCLNTANSIAVMQIAEGAEFPKQQAAAETFNLKPLKYGMDIGITKEMVEDSQFAVVEWNIREAGYQMARKLDSLIMAQIEAGDTAASNTVSGSTAVTLANVSSAVLALRANNYRPDYMIVSPQVEDDLHNIDTFHEADKLGSREVFETGRIGRIMGMTVLVSSQVTSSYAYVVDSKHALCLAEKRPVTIEQYKQENADYVGIAVSARWIARYLRAAANCVITST